MRTKFFRSLSGSGLVLALAASSYCATKEKPQDTYKAMCQGCHGSSGRATTVGKALGARDFQDQAVTKAPPSELARVIAKGKNKMPPFEGRLTPSQISDLVRYIRELK